MTVEKDVCPECDRDWTREPRPQVNHPDSVAGRHGGLGNYLRFEGGDVYLSIELECPDCDWVYQGKLKFERME